MEEEAERTESPRDWTETHPGVHDKYVIRGCGRRCGAATGTALLGLGELGKEDEIKVMTHACEHCPASSCCLRTP